MSCIRRRGFRSRVFWLLATSVLLVPLIHLFHNILSHRTRLDSHLPTLAPRQHIAFVKVHKAASSTIQNVFLRYGYTRNLTFVLGRTTNIYPNIISLTESVTDYNIEPTPSNKTFDILCSHVIYNHNAFRAIMPDDTVYLGSVRDPFQHFISSLHYFRPSYIFNITATDPVAAYLKNPSKYEPKNVKHSMTNNRMALEFGFPLEVFRSRKKKTAAITEYLDQLDSEMDLILVVEKLEESMVLLRRILNWKLQDILYIHKNSFAGMRNETRSKLSKKLYINDDTEENYRKWAKLDYTLYNFATKRLERQIKNQNPDFYDEVRHFKFVRVKVDNFCVYESRAYRPNILVIPQSEWNEQFTVNSLMCSLMQFKERYFVEEIRFQQYGHSPED
uniref:Galactosylceramide sulfotransferase n=1 Tax=Magallana gigas TaxID=29159 RepID=K1PPT9_MAGGI|eukprot:XP_011424369.1 PREDICTED: galactosylceramide sulfotransferase [Crassostrea gigas]